MEIYIHYSLFFVCVFYYYHSYLNVYVNIAPQLFAATLTLTLRPPTAFSVQSRRTDQNQFILLKALEF